MPGSILFFSYSHRDESYRDELEIHLAMLKRQGLLESWHDRRILAGDDLDQDISNHLESAHVILLMVSPYFLSSNYCYDREMQRALERHERGEVRVIPVIVHPCDWLSAPFGKLRATPKDGKPISKFPNQHDAYLEVVNDVKEALKGTPSRRAATSPREPLSTPSTPLPPRSSNLRVRRQFTDRERSEYLSSTFSYIAKFFESSLDELSKRNVGIEVAFSFPVGSEEFSVEIFQNGSRRGSCRVWVSGRNHGLTGIAYSESGRGSYNELLTVETDGYMLFSKALMARNLGSGSEERNLTQEGAAELLWSMLVGRLQ